MDMEKYLAATTQDSAFRVLSALEEGDEGLRGALLDEMDLARGLLVEALKLDLPLTDLLDGSHAEAAHTVLGQANEALAGEVRKQAEAGADSAAQQLLLRRDCFAFLAHQAGLSAGTEPDSVNEAYKETAAIWLSACDTRAGRTPQKEN